MSVWSVHKDIDRATTIIEAARLRRKETCKENRDGTTPRTLEKGMTTAEMGDFARRDLRQPGKETSGNNEEYNGQGIVEIFQYEARRNRTTLHAGRNNGKSV